MIRRAYLDIETTGLSKRWSEVTVVGVGIEREEGLELHQLVGDELNHGALLRTLADVNRLYTYNGRRFDLPFIKYRLGLDIEKTLKHIDLMFFCWQRNLKGGLKNVERLLGIERELPDAGGLDAVRWWKRYAEHGDRAALDLLLRYNAEDVANLRILRDCLHVS